MVGTLLINESVSTNESLITFSLKFVVKKPFANLLDNQVERMAPYLPERVRGRTHYKLLKLSKVPMHCGITDFRNSSPGLERLETHERTTPACLAGRGFHHNFAHILACYTWPSMEDDAHFKHLSLGPSQNQAKSQCQFSHASQII